MSCGKCDPDRHSCFIDGTPSLVLLLLHWVVQHLCQSLTLIEFGIRLLKNCKLRQDFFVAVYKLLLALFRMKIAVFSCNCFIRSNKGSCKKTLQELRMLSSAVQWKEKVLKLNYPAHAQTKSHIYMVQINAGSGLLSKGTSATSSTAV